MPNDPREEKPKPQPEEGGVSRDVEEDREAANRLFATNTFDRPVSRASAMAYEPEGVEDAER